jgi:sugar phosphate isomerase/epimerase
MKIAVSNIAWAPAERAEAYATLRRHGATGLEIAPGLFLDGEPDRFEPSDAAVARLLDEVADAGLQLVSMQSLLFGVQDAALFGTPEQHGRLMNGLERAIALAGRLGIPNLVFGSPLQRIVPEGMSQEDAIAFAADSFRTLADQAVAQGAVIAIEPNPSAYGTNFLTDMESAHAFVLQADHPGVTLNFDIGALHMTGRFGDIDTLIERMLPVVSHVHVSEPQLAPAPATRAHADAVLQALDAAGYDRWVSIEMRNPGDDALSELDRALGRLTGTEG